jgi:putative transposase
MGKWRKSAHVVYQCGYHIVWCPKHGYRILKGDLARFVEKSIRVLCEWKKVDVLEGSVQEDHVHLVVSIPPKVSVSELMEILKGKTAIKLFKGYPGLRKKPYWGNHFWSRGYCVSTVGVDEEKIRGYVSTRNKGKSKRKKSRRILASFRGRGGEAAGSAGGRSLAKIPA